MTLPIPSNVFNDGELTNEASWYARVFTPINNVYAQALSHGGFLYVESEEPTSKVTLSSSSTNFLVPITTPATFSLTSTRRVRILVTARFNTASGTPGTYTIYAAYVTGTSATLSGSVRLGIAGAQQCLATATGGGGSPTGTAEHSVLLAAGVYTAFPIVQRVANGSATDTALLGYCAVYDMGNT